MQKFGYGGGLCPLSQQGLPDLTHSVAISADDIEYRFVEIYYDHKGESPDPRWIATQNRNPSGNARSNKALVYRAKSVHSPNLPNPTGTSRTTGALTRSTIDEPAMESLGGIRKTVVVKPRTAFAVKPGSLMMRGNRPSYAEFARGVYAIKRRQREAKKTFEENKSMISSHLDEVDDPNDWFDIVDDDDYVDADNWWGEER